MQCRSDPQPDTEALLQHAAVTPVGPRIEGHGVSFSDAFRVWCRVAALSFGGPAAQIAVMHRILVDEKRWVSESRFLHALSYCMLLPGPRRSNSRLISAGSCTAGPVGSRRAASSFCPASSPSWG